MIECPDCGKTIVDPCAVAMIERLREQLDVRRALTPEPHHHAFVWTNSTTAVDTEPPPDVTCACGMTYASHKKALRAHEGKGHGEG